MSRLQLIAMVRDFAWPALDRQIGHFGHDQDFLLSARRDSVFRNPPGKAAPKSLITRGFRDLVLRFRNQCFSEHLIITVAYGHGAHAAADASISGEL
jgi:hypothetical protein